MVCLSIEYYAVIKSEVELLQILTWNNQDTPFSGKKKNQVIKQYIYYIKILK